MLQKSEKDVTGTMNASSFTSCWKTRKFKVHGALNSQTWQNVEFSRKTTRVTIGNEWSMSACNIHSHHFVRKMSESDGSKTVEGWVVSLYMWKQSKKQRKGTLRHSFLMSCIIIMYYQKNGCATARPLILLWRDTKSLSFCIHTLKMELYYGVPKSR